jgi:hypothetical protein
MPRKYDSRKTVGQGLTAKALKKRVIPRHRSENLQIPRQLGKTFTGKPLYSSCLFTSFHGPL